MGFEYENKVLNEITKILVSKDSLKDDVVNLFDVFEIYSKLFKDYMNDYLVIKYNIKKRLAENFYGYKLLDASVLDNNCYLMLSDFLGNNIKIVFGKIYENVFIREIDCDENFYIDDVKLFLSVNTQIDKLFELADKINNLFNEYSFNINSNSSFRVDVFLGVVRVKKFGVFNLRLVCFEDNVMVEGDSDYVLSCINGCEISLLRKIFVKIDDLPIDIREGLYIKRQEYLEYINDKNERHSLVINKQPNLKNKF